MHLRVFSWVHVEGRLSSHHPRTLHRSRQAFLERNRLAHVILEPRVDPLIALVAEGRVPTLPTPHNRHRHGAPITSVAH